MNAEISVLEKEERPIIIYGASVVGEIVYKYLVKKNVRIVGFCDNNPHKVGEKLLGVDVYSYKQCVDLFSESIFLLCMNDIKYAYEQTKNDQRIEVFKTSHLIEAVLKDDKFLESELQGDRLLVVYSLRTCLSAQKYYNDDSKLYIRTLQLLVTERCSLKCAECSNLIQYYDRPKDCKDDLTVQTIERVAELFDEISDMHLIGGEPFINKNIADYILQIEKHDNIGNIIIFTNGTIVPDDRVLEACENEKVIINISNYGKLSRNKDRLVLELKNRGIHFNVYDDLKWGHHSVVKDYGLNEEQKKRRLCMCRSAVNCTSIGEGKLFRCYYANHAFRLQAVPEDINEYLDILDPTIRKKEIYDFLYTRDCFDICGWCKGSGFSSESLEPAVQTDSPIKYNRYKYNS